MGALLELGLPVLLALFGAMIIALTSTQASKGFTGWLAEFLVNIPIVGSASIKQIIRLDEWIASTMKPQYDALAQRVAHWFNGLGQTHKYDSDLAYRQAQALADYGYWQGSVGAREALARATKAFELANAKNALTKAPPLPQRRITQKEADAEFERLIKANFKTELNTNFPKWDWNRGKWLAFLALGDIHQGAVVTTPQPTKPHVAPVKAHPQPKRSPVPNPTPNRVPGHVEGPGAEPVPIAPPQPDTNPHTGDRPSPDPGTQYVPSVISGKDKWARGQIVTLKARHKSLLDHLGPLAFLAIPAIGISTLIGLLECKNFGRFARGICNIPVNLFGDLMGLLLDALILSNWCTVLPAITAAFDLVEGPLVQIIDDAGDAFCNGAYAAPPKMAVPTLYLWDPTQIAA